MISLNWVKDYINLDGEDLKELAIKVTKAGVNIENVISKRIDNLVIGHISSVTEHPDSDHLHVCMVDIGTEVIQVVCGASNVKEGINVIVSLPGAILPGHIEIKKGVIRGIESNGMICALSELGLEEKTEENYNKGIEIADPNLRPGTDANIYLGLDDVVYELDVHKHRNNDCYYHIGFAYEIGAIINKKVMLPASKYEYISDNISNYLSLEVRTDKCPYYLAKMVKGVKIGESPEFIKERLISAGMRPINNVVDISNYVMLEYGQPLHFFDKNKLGSKILVRNANSDEEIVTLDGVKRKLVDSDIVITDTVKPVCIAGVMGGENSDIDNNTADIIIESAIFEATSIRYTAARLDLKSEASIRYGKGLNYEYTNAAIERACYLLNKYAGATILDGTLTHDKVDKQDKVVAFKCFDINKLLGITLTNDDIKVELDRLDFCYELDDNVFKVTIPKRRLDIDPNINDIAEEIGRLYGYYNLVATLPVVETKKGVYVGDVLIRKQISKRLRNLGLTETKNYTLVSEDMAKLFRYEEKKQIKLPNPMSSDKSVIRTSLLPSLLNVYDYNKARGVQNIFLYEIAKTYSDDYKEDSKVAILMSGDYIGNVWSGDVIKSDFYLIKGIVCNILDYLGFKNRYSFVQSNNENMHPGITAKIILDLIEIGVIGQVHPSLRDSSIYVAEFSMSALIDKKIKPIKYKEPSKYPSICKDMAFEVSNDINANDMVKEIIKTGGPNLIDVSIFDLYKMNDNKSLAFSLTFNSTEKTLTEEEVMLKFNEIIKEIETKFNAKLRNK